MKKLNSFFKNKIAITQVSLCLLLTTILVFVGNFSLIKNKFIITKTYSHNVDEIMFLLEILFNYFLVFLIFYLSSFNKKLFKIITIFCFFLSGFCSYVVNHYGVFIDQTIIANIIDNIAVFGDIIMIDSFLIYSFFYLVLPIFLLLKFEYQIKKNKKTLLIILSCFIVLTILLSLINHQRRKALIYAYPPISIIKSVIRYYDEIGLFRDKNKKLNSINEIVRSKINHNKVEGLKIVLIIGESARSISFSINGYERITTPLLIKEKNLLSFKDVLPCDVYTSHSVTCMMSGKGRSKFEFGNIDQESVIKVFEKNKFATYWHSSQKAFGDNNALINLGMEAQDFSFADKIAERIGANLIYDEYLFSDFDKDIKNPKDSFIILQTLGSHFLLHERYPENFAKYSPACNKRDIKKCTKEEVYNSYDNTILYTDFIISSIINKLKNENAILIYVSDHGSFLGENGTYYHATYKTYASKENKVPMFLWMSDNLLKNNFYKKKFLNAKRKINSKLSHDNLFYSLLDCSGVDVEDKDKRKLSVCR